MENTQRKPIPYLATFLHLSFGLLFITSATSVSSSDDLLINCGFPSNITTSNGRNWTTDVGSSFIFFTHPNTSTTTEASTQGVSVPQVPYMTARLFYSNLTYSLPISPGAKFIRFHFYPTSYLTLNKTNAIFSVFIGNFTLLHNFSPSLTADYFNLEYITKEFCFNLETHVLNITFIPTSSGLSNTYGFINAIEIVSVPVNLYIRDEGISMVGHSNLFHINNHTALETVYRLNVGGQEIQPEDDTSMFRTWSRDDIYIFGAAFGVEYYNLTVDIRYPPAVPNFTAPENVYRTYRSMGPTAAINANYNLTWVFSVDSGFFYLLRLHFCEINDRITKVNQRVFNIFIGNLSASDGMDVIAYTGGSGGDGVPMYIDYVVKVVSHGSSSGKEDLWLALHPATKYKPNYYDAMLNGLEIFKLNHTGGNLAGLNPPPIQPAAVVHDPTKAPLREYQSGLHNRVVVIIVGAVGGVLLTLGLVVFFLVSHRKGKVKVKDVISRWFPERTNLCRRFSLAEIIAATDNFDDDRLIGIGGFGRVYKGHINGGVTTVAVKRGNLTSTQGLREFQAEVEMLSNLRHIHLVPLIGFCQEGEELIIVYEYMACGTLYDHLYEAHNRPLTWKQRLKICIGVACGLDYLHSGAKHTIIHRDVKTKNILLDEKWIAKVSDFGLSKLGPTGLSQSHVTTNVKGTVGYIDPEYYQLHQITEKSDVYSFGVVLFEVLCGRPPLDRRVAAEQVFLPDWAAKCYRNGTLDQIVDPYLKGNITSKSLEIFGQIAVKCVSDQGIERPTMSDVLWYLEFALQLQESAADDDIVVETEDGETSLRASLRDRRHLPENNFQVLSSAGDTVWSRGGRSMPDQRRAISLKILRSGSLDSIDRWKMSMACGRRSFP